MYLKVWVIEMYVKFLRRSEIHILFHFILLYLILFYSILVYFIYIFYFILFSFVEYFVLFYFILCFALFFLVFSRSLCLVSTHLCPSCSVSESFRFVLFCLTYLMLFYYFCYAISVKILLLWSLINLPGTIIWW